MSEEIKEVKETKKRVVTLGKHGSKDRRRRIVKLFNSNASREFIAEKEGITVDQVGKILWYAARRATGTKPIGFGKRKRSDKGTKRGPRGSYKKRAENPTYMPKVNIDNVAYDLLVRVENSIDLISLIRFCQKLGAKGIQIK